MVFPSVPVYMDPPNWNHQQQQQARQQQVNTAGDAPPTQFLQTPPPQPPSAATAGTTIRPTSMAERARLAKIPQPEPALKCPRCNSTNTKFCYFNNYSLTQPRHFCKACRRYWTRGGALRSVPVGGGCRRNKRNKSGSASSAAANSSSVKSSAANSAGPSFSSTFPTTRSSSLPQLQFMAPSQYSLQDYGAPNASANFSGLQQIGIDYQASLGLDQQWRLHQTQQVPFFHGLEPPAPPPQITAAAPPAGLFPFGVQAKPSPSGLITQLASAKMDDDNNINININNPHHQYLGVARNTDQWWGSSGANVGGDSGGAGGRWAGDLTGFNNTSSSGNLL